MQQPQSLSKVGLAQLTALSIAAASQPEPLAVSPKVACVLAGVSMSRLYQLMRAGEVESYHEGFARRITVASIKARVARLVQESASKVAA